MMERLPYRIIVYLWEEERCSFLINKSSHDGYNTSDSFHLEIPADFAVFIQKYCTCSFCGATISKELKSCTCAESKNSDYHLEVSFSHDADATDFDILKRKEKSRIAQLFRKKRIQENGGSYTKKEILDLHNIQKGMCYFCGNTISNNSSSYHIDHYDSLYHGGSNSIDNIVLTCPKCNLDKNIMDGDDYERIARKKRTAEIGRKLGVIRRQINIYKQSVVNPSSEITDL